MNTQDKFWAVWRADWTEGPNKRHYEKSNAIHEAGRLARKENARYYVLESIGVAGVVEPPIQYQEFDQ